MKKTLILLVGLLASTLYAQNTMEQTVHQFTMETLEGDQFDFSSLKGKKIMAVNTAS